jgi:hypothetical protein
VMVVRPTGRIPARNKRRKAMRQKTQSAASTSDENLAVRVAGFYAVALIQGSLHGSGSASLRRSGSGVRGVPWKQHWQVVGGQDGARGKPQERRAARLIRGGTQPGRSVSADAATVTVHYTRQSLTGT